MSVASQQPSSQQLGVSFSDNAVKLSCSPAQSDEAIVRVMDVLGRVAYEGGISRGGTNISIPNRCLVSGNYFAVLMDGARRASTRFQK